MVVTALAAVVFDVTGLLPGTLDDLDQVGFSYVVGPLSFVVAPLAGAAPGCSALTSAKSAALVGVFISVTTVPSVGFAATALVEGRHAQAAGSALQLAVDLVGIVVAAVTVLLVSRRAEDRRRGLRRAVGGVGVRALVVRG